MANKHKHKFDHNCLYLERYRQVYYHKGYDDPAEYCPESYFCARPGVGMYPDNYPHCNGCTFKKEKENGICK